MAILGIDIETFSATELTKSGVYRYVEDPTFAILLFAYAWDDGSVRIVDLASGEALPKDIVAALRDEGVSKAAFNAQFERVCLSRHLGIRLDASGWRCTQAQAAYAGYPLSLKTVAEAMKLEQQKPSEGNALIRYFSMPCRPTQSNGDRTRNLPAHARDKWQAFCDYCCQDVEVERAIRKRLQSLPDDEQKLYALDQRINDLGVRIDQTLVCQAIRCDAQYGAQALEEAKALTGLENPASIAQLKGWFSAEGTDMAQLDKKSVQAMRDQATGGVQRVLTLRLALAKTSVKKYVAMQRAVCGDDRIRGLLQYYGASRSGRWAGRLTQVQNLPQNHLPDLTTARNLMRAGSFDDVEFLYGDTPKVLSELIRTAFIPATGHRFIVADFSAIEARVLAWLAGEQWVLDEFAAAGKTYEATASRMFHVPMEQITKGSPFRQKGKVAQLACGYGGGSGALINMGALDNGLKEEELQPIVDAWRATNAKIVAFWWAVDRAAKLAITKKTRQQVGGLAFYMERGALLIRLPSGRTLRYVDAAICMNKFGRDGISYMGVGMNKQWCLQQSYGPKLVENVVQGIARDLLAFSLVNLDQAGYRIAFHVHDEVILEMPNGQGSLEEVCDIMACRPTWARSLPLRADGYECDYYRKD